MSKYRIEPGHSELFVEARSNVHPIEIRTQGLDGTIALDVDGGDLDLSTAPRATLEVAADFLRSGILSVGDSGDSLQIERAGTLDTRHFELPAPKILMLEMQPEINVRAKIQAVRLD